MANRNRGESEVKLGGKSFLLVPNFEAVCELEDKLDYGLPELLTRFSKKKTLGFKQVTALFHAGIKAGGKDLSFEEVGKLVMATHFRDLINPAAVFMSELWYQGRDEESEGSEPKKEESAKP